MQASYSKGGWSGSYLSKFEIFDLSPLPRSIRSPPTRRCGIRDKAFGVMGELVVAVMPSKHLEKSDDCIF